MEARAVQRHLGLPAPKVRQVVDLIRGKPVAEALAILQFTPRRAARAVEKTLRSAVANAVRRDDPAAPAVKEEELYVSRVHADVGRTLKRLRPRARGAANRILKRQSHVTIVVSDGRPAAAEPEEA